MLLPVIRPDWNPVSLVADLKWSQVVFVRGTPIRHVRKGVLGVAKLAQNVVVFNSCAKDTQTFCLGSNSLGG